ncbi:MAG: hypothetical protein CGW95_14975 [Phenylobacterium zucineum]|nr:MAG: hypothetical protein CGW95_14975 [Phenylobacterium zucineum]
MMIQYKLVKFDNNVLTMQFSDGGYMNVQVPVVDGLFLEGAALTQMLDSYAVRYEQNQAVNTTVPSVSNAQAILNMLSEPSPDEKAAMARKQRARLLTLTDWTQAQDSELSADIKAAYSAYRSALRNMTAQAGFPTSFTWPVPPAPVKNGQGRAFTLADGTPTLL